MFPSIDYRDELHSAIAAALGMSLAELEAAFAKGHTVQSLAELRAGDLNTVSYTHLTLPTIYSV